MFIKSIRALTHIVFFFEVFGDFGRIFGGFWGIFEQSGARCRVPGACSGGSGGASWVAMLFLGLGRLRCHAVRVLRWGENQW